MSFYKELMQSVHEGVIENSRTLEQELTSQILDYISEDLPDEPTLFYCENKEDKGNGFYKVNAYSYSEENGILDMFVTQYYDTEEPSTLYASDIDRAHNLLMRFFMSCVESDKLHAKYQDDDPDVAEVIEFISSLYKSDSINQLRFYILSNGNLARDKAMDLITITGKNIPFEEIVIDLRQIQVMEESSGASYINVELKDTYQKPIECLELQDGNPNVDCYMAIMPASILARVYDMYKEKLLDRNVRGFLGMKDINKGMAKTLKEEGDLFFSYNNGISSIASGIELESDGKDGNGRKYITKITNWQIVNGGQTTNTIYNAFMDKDNLDNVNVSMKISVIKIDNDDQEDIIANIANFANTQNKVDSADLSSNHKVFKELNTISRREWAPITSPNKGTRWFFERTKGQYVAEKKKACDNKLTSAKAKRFVKENPTKQKFTKTDFAKLYTSWQQRPEIATLGAIKCFNFFKEQYMPKIEVDTEFFHGLVACDIIDQEIATIFKQSEYKGYGNIVRNYVLSILSLKSNKRLDLEAIWQSQAVPETLKAIIKQCVDIVFKYVQQQTSAGKDPTNEAKKTTFWDNICTKVVDIRIPSGLLKRADISTLTPEQKEIIDKVKGYNDSTLEALIKWADKTKKLSIMERKHITRFIKLRENEEQISYDVAKDIFDLTKKSIDLGFRL